MSNKAEEALNLFEFDGYPVAVDRENDRAWKWTIGAWRRDPVIISTIYTNGEALDHDEFVKRYPYAVLELLHLKFEP